MALHPEFPQSPYAELLPDQRWFPAAEELRSDTESEGESDMKKCRAKLAPRVLRNS